jgi:negative regulator of sigma E activity
MADTNEQPHARVTLQMLYDKQLENERLLIELTTRLSAIEGIPKRVRELELKQARGAWVEKVAYAALIAGVTALVGGIMTTMGG